MTEFRFIHSSDLHLGRRFSNFPEEIRGRLLEARHTAIGALASAAREHEAEHVLIAGDLFDTETPSERIWRQALAAMGAAQGLEWWILPGNHDQEIERALAQLRSDAATPQAPLPPPRVKKGHSVNGLQFDVREALYALLGVDLTQIHGLGPYVAVKLVSECGTDMTKWPSAKHFTSWLCLAPGNKISGGKVLSSRTRRSSNRAASLLRLAATTVGRTDTALGAF